MANEITECVSCNFTPRRFRFIAVFARIISDRLRFLRRSVALSAPDKTMFSGNSSTTVDSRLFKVISVLRSDKSWFSRSTVHFVFHF